MCQGRGTLDKPLVDFWRFLQMIGIWLGNCSVYLPLLGGRKEESPDVFVCGGPLKNYPDPGSSRGPAWSLERNSFCFIVSFKAQVLKSTKYIALENANTLWMIGQPGSNNLLHRPTGTLNSRGGDSCPHPSHCSAILLGC